MCLLPWVVSLKWSLLCLAWKPWKVIGWATTSTSGLVTHGVKCLIITALQKDNEIMECWRSGMGFLNGTMTGNCGLCMFLLNLLHFWRYESSRQDYALPQQIIQMYKSYWGFKCIWVMKCQTSWEQTILIMSFIVLEPFYGWYVWINLKMSNLYIRKRFVLMVHTTEQCTAQKLDLAAWRAGNENKSSFEGTKLLCIYYITYNVLLKYNIIILLKTAPNHLCVAGGGWCDPTRDVPEMFL